MAIVPPVIAPVPNPPKIPASRRFPFTPLYIAPPIASPPSAKQTTGATYLNTINYNTQWAYQES